MFRTMFMKIKKWFFEKPKKDFWMSAFITLFLLRWVTPTMLVFLVMFQVGLVVPELTDEKMLDTQQKVAEEMARSYVDIMIILMSVGRDLAQSNPLVAKILYYGIANFVWVVYAGIILLLLNLFRYFTSWAYIKCHKKKK